MKITLPSLRGNKTSKPVTRSKSWAEKSTVKMKALWRDHSVKSEGGQVEFPPPVKRFTSSPDLSSCSNVTTCCGRSCGHAPTAAISAAKRDPLANQRESSYGSVFSSPTSSLNVLSSPTSSINTVSSTVSHPLPLAQIYPIKQSSLTMILPDRQERVPPPFKPKRSKNEAKKKKEVTSSCVQWDCVVCTLARPDLRHRVHLELGFWREFY